MSIADSPQTSETKLILERPRGFRAELRTGDLSLDDLGMDADPSSARNFANETWHAFRRRWIASLFTGVVIGSLTAIGVWYRVVNQYTATAVLRVSMGQSSVLEPSQNRDGTTAFDVYKRTQRQLLR